MPDTTVKFLHSDMLGAPVLSGQAGALIALLDACLVNGFGSVTVDSIVIAAGVATITRAAGLPFEDHAVALIAGATVSGGSINGERKIISATATTATFEAAGIANQTATGAITVRLAPVGFAKTYSGTNLAAYKSADAAATGCMLRVDDTGTTTARVVGYESMVDISTGAGLFPHASQISGGGWWPKSDAADSSARKWVLFGDGRMFYLAVQYTSGSALNSLTAAFGDVVATKSPDAYSCMLSCAEVSPVGTAAGTRNASELDYGSQVGSAATVYMPRNYTGLGAPAQLTRSFPLLVGTAGARSGAVAGGVPYPNYADGGLYVTEHYLIESATNVVRGRAPGLCPSPQVIGNLAFSNRGAVTGIADLPGRTLRAINTAGVFFVDVTGPWR